VPSCLHEALCGVCGEIYRTSASTIGHALPAIALSGVGILSFLLEYRQSPVEATNNVDDEDQGEKEGGLRSLDIRLVIAAGRASNAISSVHRL